MSELQVVKDLTPLLRRQAAAVGALVALGTVVAATEGLGIGLLIPLLGGHGGAGLSAGPFGGLLAAVDPALRSWTLLAGLAVLIVVRSLSTLGHGLLLARLTSGVVHDLRGRVFARLLSVEQAELDRSERGALLQLLESQTWETSAALGTVAQMATRACKVLVLGAVLLLISWRLTLAVGVALALVGVLVRWLTRRVASLSRIEMRAWEAMAQRMLQSLHGMRTIRAFGRERDEAAALARCSELERRTFERLQRLHAVVAPATELSVAMIMLVVLGVAITSPALVPAALAFLAILHRLHPQMQQLDTARVELAAASAPVAAVMRRCREPASLPPTPALPARRLRGPIAFRNVDFRYEPGAPLALHDVTFEVPSGMTTAVVGPSGAGKSTLVELLLRFAEPSAGEIRVGESALASVPAAEWRRCIALVSQDAHLFDATIAQNIAYGRPAPASREAIEAAAREADADAFIRALPAGYETRVGDDAVRLSSGQRQRIALARAFLRDPEVLILDEATNAVDAISAELIHRAVARRAAGCTVILVTHRLAAVEAADQIVLLEAGRVREVGRAGELRRRRGVFARLEAAHDGLRAVGEVA